MNKVGKTLKEIRSKRGLLLREVAAAISIDPSLLSKIENNQRMPTKEQANALAKYYKADSNAILIAYSSDKLVDEVKGNPLALQAMHAAEKKIKHLKKKK